MVRSRRSRARWAWAVLLLVATGCGGGSATTELSAEGGLAAAFASVEGASSYVVTTSTGQRLDSELLGVSDVSEIDVDRPTAMGEVTPAGQHLLVDLTPVFEPLFRDFGDFGELGFEMWSDDDRITIDTTGFQSIVDLNPDAELGPFEPGISFIDLDGLAMSDPDLVAALFGTAVPDLETIARSLPDALDSVERISTDPETFRGTGIHADVLDAMGTDAEQTARGAAAGLGISGEVDPEAAARFYIDLYESTPSEVIVEVDPSGRARSVAVTTDLSGFFTAFVDDEAFLPGISEDERAALRRQVAGDTWTLETLTTFEPVAGLELPPVPSTDDDRTEEWRMLLEPTIASGG